MLKLLTVFAAAVCFAYISERNTKAAAASGQSYCVRNDWAFLFLTVILALFAGLRTGYNDTGNYIRAFYDAPDLAAWLAEPKNFNLFTNPLFYFYQSAIKSLFNDPQMLILISAVITQACFLLFFKRYCRHFAFSVFIYFTLGTFVFTLAANKQVLGMAIVTLSFPYLEKKNWLGYYLVIFVAMLVHTYALAFAVLPLFGTRPWRVFTVLFIAVIAAVMLNFEDTITSFMEQANDLGKTLSEEEVFDHHTINLFRLAVYAVPPVVSLLFQRWIFVDESRMDNILIHMSIISLAFMSMGTQSGANMFARMAMYFELGTICCLPEMLKKTFDRKSYKLVSMVGCACFFLFFLYANMINLDFNQEFQSISLLQFVTSLF